MTTLVVGASGATGRLLVQQLLNRGLNVRVIVRSPDKLPDDIRSHDRLSIAQATVLDLSDAELVPHVNGCDAVASCLGHKLTARGIYGQPRMLVADTTRRLCEAINATNSGRRVKFVLMNTAGNSNRDIPEGISFGQRCAVGLIRLLLPPHRDNENAADYLRTEVSRSDGQIEWVVVRPDSLLNQSSVSPYEVYPSPIRSAVFDPGKTSRINVAHFMAELITCDAIWSKWSGQMPVIYNRR